MLSEIKPNLIDDTEEAITFLKTIQPDTGIFQNNYSYACYVSLYLFALQFCSDKLVLDAASGLGYGSYILSTTAKQVIGIDLLAEKIKYANINYHHYNIEFIPMNVVDTSFHNEYFDSIVSVETFEHIPKEHSVSFIEEMKRILKAGGYFILSTPNRPIHTQITKTIDHVNEVDVDELYELLHPRFNICKFYYQRKKILEEMKTFYSIIKIDKFKLRQIFPQKLRQIINRFIAKDLTKDIDELLPTLQVHEANSLNDVKDAVIQVVVCQK